MSKKLDLNKIARKLSPLERAQMVTQLGMIGIQEIDSPDQPYPNRNEIRQLVETCPREDASAYNKLIDIKEHVWSRILPLLEMHLSQMKICEGRFSILHYQLAGTSWNYCLLKYAHQIPKVISHKQYRQALYHARMTIMCNDIPIYGDHGLAQQEAFALLKHSNSKIEFDYLHDYLEYVSQGSNSQEQDAWETLIKEQVQRIHQAINANQLLTGHNNDTVLLGSYLEWNERLQIFGGENNESIDSYHPLAEWCIELRYYEGRGICFTGDPEIQNQDLIGRRIVFATKHDRVMMPEFMDEYHDALVDKCTMELPITIPDMLDGGTITFKDKRLINRLMEFKAETESLYSEVIDHIALIQAIEMKYFGGFEIVFRDKTNLLSTVINVPHGIRQIVEQHNQILNDIAQQMNQLSNGRTTYSLECIDDLIIKLDSSVDQAWVDKKLAEYD